VLCALNILVPIVSIFPIYLYASGLVVRLRPDQVEQVDSLSPEELRSRSNMVQLLVDEGLRRREAEALQAGER
jgi:hypothetical protein